REFEREILGGCEGIKPGWVRVNFNYFIDDEVFRYIVAAVALVAEHGWKLLPDYRFDAASGLWRHRSGPVEPPLRFAGLGYAPDGTLTYPRHDDRSPEGVYREALAAARELFARLPDVDPGTASVAGQLGEDFEQLRWFELPAECLT